MIAEQHLGIKSAGLSEDSLGGRLPLIAVADLSGAQRGLYDYMEHSRIPEALKGGYEAQLPDGRLIGPFNSFLRMPEIARALNGWVDAFDEHSKIAPDVRQVIVLMVGAYWEPSTSFTRTPPQAAKPDFRRQLWTRLRRIVGQGTCRRTPLPRTGSSMDWWQRGRFRTTFMQRPWPCSASRA